MAFCLLKPAHARSKLCKPSYEGVKQNIAEDNCQFLTSHDDFSLLRDLPGVPRVISQVRIKTLNPKP